MTVHKYMIKIYCYYIKGNRRTIDQIPQEYQDYVLQALEDENKEE